MKHLFFLPFTLFFIAVTPRACLAQSMEVEVIGSAGTSIATTVGSLQWTVGEPMIRTVAQGAILSEGFHQTVIWEIVPVHQAPDLQLSVWPNPSTNYLEVKTDRPVSVTLFDLSGRKVVEDTTIEKQGVLQLSQLPAGAYFLEVSDATRHRLATYKILHLLP